MAFLKSTMNKILRHHQVIKRVMPMAHTVLNTLDMAETTKNLAKPIIDANLEAKKLKAMKIFVIQEKYPNEYVLKIDGTGILVRGKLLDEVFSSFLVRLETFYENKIISEDKSIRQAQMKLLNQMSKIEQFGDDFKKHIYRIEVDKTKRQNTKGHPAFKYKRTKK